MLNNNCAVSAESLTHAFPDIRPKLDRAPNLLWAASYPKSGSTLLRLFVSAYLGDGTVDINSYKGIGDAQTRLYQEISPKPLEELGEKESFYLRTAVLYRMSEMPHEQLVKTHSCFGSCMGIELIPSDLSKGALVPVRDPRDVAISYAHHSNISIDEAIDLMADETAMGWRNNIYQYMSSWSMHVKSWIEAAPQQGIPILIVPYEGMVDRPLETFRHVAIALRREFDEEKFQRSVASVQFKNLAAQEETNGFLEKPETSKKFFRQGKVGQWKSILTLAQKARIELAHGKMMKRLGYL